MNVCVCLCVRASLPSAWVATLSAAELSPWPLLLWATTLKRYLVSGMRFWMVTCISPGRLVFTTRSLMWTHTDTDTHTQQNILITLMSFIKNMLHIIRENIIKRFSVLQKVLGI